MNYTFSVGQITKLIKIRTNPTLNKFLILFILPNGNHSSQRYLLNKIITSKLTVIWIKLGKYKCFVVSGSCFDAFALATPLLSIWTTWGTISDIPFAVGLQSKSDEGNMCAHSDQNFPTQRNSLKISIFALGVCTFNLAQGKQHSEGVRKKRRLKTTTQKETKIPS